MGGQRVDRIKFQPIHNELCRLFRENRKGVWKVPIVTLNTYWKVYNYIFEQLIRKVSDIEIQNR